MTAQGQPGWRIPDIQDWENIIAYVLNKDTSEIKKQSFFTGGSPAFTEAIHYGNQFKFYNIWVEGQITSKRGLKLRRIVQIQNGGPNQNNLIIMGFKIEEDGKTFDPEAVLYLIKED